MFESYNNRLMPHDLPLGSTLPWYAGDRIPGGWVVDTGQTLTRAAYPDYFFERGLIPDSFVLPNSGSIVKVSYVYYDRAVNGANALTLQGAGLSVDGSFAANSDTLIPSQKSILSYLTSWLPGKDTKATPIAGDGFVIVDSADSNKLKRVLYSALSALLLPSGSTVQLVESHYYDVATGTTAIPQDNTIPQITEGNEYMSVTITPTNASNNLIVRSTGLYDGNTNQHVQIALFKEGTNNALSATRMGIGNTGSGNATLYYKGAAGTTSPIKFSVRAGQNDGGVTTFNGFNSARILGAVEFVSYIEVTEVKA